MNKKSLFEPYNKIDGEIWKKITNCVNYEVSNLGRIRNTKTGKILSSSNGKYMLHCKELGYSWCSHSGDRGTFLINNIVKATFENVQTFGQHIK